MTSPDPWSDVRCAPCNRNAHPDCEGLAGEHPCRCGCPPSLDALRAFVHLFAEAVFPEEPR